MKAILCVGVFLLTLIKISLCNHCAIVATENGRIGGTCLSFMNTTVVEFLGIPYAKPPVGQLRFQKPQPVECWRGILDATKLPNACIQNSSSLLPWIDHLPGKSEDCLYLNIFAPIGINDEKKAVLFWIHGGSLQYGSGRLPNYNGTVLAAKKDIIIVTFNYRLSILGYLRTPDSKVPGNVAIYDFLLALEWVKKNIKYFGGDPDRITVCGQSSGGILPGISATSPLFKGLYSRIIMQSGSVSNLGYLDLKQSMDFSNQVAIEVGCANETFTIEHNTKDVLECMRYAEPMKLFHATEISLMRAGLLDYLPQYGDEILPHDPRKAMLEGNFEYHDILIGVDKDDGTILLPMGLPQYYGDLGQKSFNMTLEFAKNFVYQSFRNILSDPEPIIDYYLSGFNGKEFEEIRRNVSVVFGDYFFYCPSTYTAEGFLRKENKVYFYINDHRSSISPMADWLEVTHFEEVEFIFGDPFRYPQSYTVEEIGFAEDMMEFWANFVKYGDPRTEEVYWPTYKRSEPLYLVLSPGNYRIGNDAHIDNCNFWRQPFNITIN
uniref:Carboxylic ester hydrolase n=1 Tax=Liphistius sp. SGP-2016 TaxID=1905180 RepID=A0A4Q8K283_9ARAC